MNDKKQHINQVDELIRKKCELDLESPLASVIERDGVVMLTPIGVRKYAKKLCKIKSVKKYFNFKNYEQEKDDIADIELFDAKIIACSVDATEPPTAICVQVNNCPHTRSEYVVSLRDCFLGDCSKEERVSPDQHFEYMNTLRSTAVNSKSYDSVLLASEAEPWMVKTQNNNYEKSLWKSIIGKIRKIKRVFIRPEARVVAQQAKIQEKDDKSVASVFERIRVKSFLLAFLGLAIIAVIPAFALSTYKAFAMQKSALEKKGNEAAAFAVANISVNDALPVSHQALADVSVKFRETARMLDNSKLLAFSAAAVAPSKYRGARALIEVGEKTSEAAKIITLGFGKIFDDPKRPLLERVIALGTHAEAAIPLLQDAEIAARLVKPDHFPAEYQNAIAELPKQIEKTQSMVRELKLISDALTIFLGKDRLRNYLLVFQNDSELRPSGGFMGSVAEIRFLNGKVHSVYVPPGGPYDLKSQLTERVQAPEPMHLINPLWQFQDANWHADFSKTANSINWFWNKSGQPTLDGVIAVNASFMENVLNVLGPIDMPEYGKVITAENFYLETQKVVELEYDKIENTPKKFIGDMFDKILEGAKDLSKEQWLMLAAEASEALDKKSIQIAMFNHDEEVLINQFGWGGSFKESDGDFLAIIGANIAGQKTDLVIKESVLHEIIIESDGSMISRVLLNRKHEGIKNELFYGVRNVQYVRFYLPKGSEVLEAEGFLPPPEKLFKKPLPIDKKDELLEMIEATQKPGPNTTVIMTEGIHTVVGGWLQLDPGRSQDVVISYRLPFTIQDVLRNLNNEMPESAKSEQSRAAYLMLYTSQSGKVRPLTTRLIVDSAWLAVWSKEAMHENSKIEAGKSILELNTIWDRDRTAAVLFNAK